MRRCGGARRCGSTAATKLGHCRCALLDRRDRFVAGGMVERSSAWTTADKSPRPGRIVSGAQAWEQPSYLPAAALARCGEALDRAASFEAATASGCLADNNCCSAFSQYSRSRPVCRPSCSQSCRARAAIFSSGGAALVALMICFINRCSCFLPWPGLLRWITADGWGAENLLDRFHQHVQCEGLG